jgi:hypothetical protein
LAGPTFAAQMLTKIEAMLLGKADNDVAKYEIAGRSLEKYSFGELENLRKKYKAEVQAEKIQEDLANGLGNPSRKVLTRF